MSIKIDYEKKQFEVRFLKEFTALTRLTQAAALSVARRYVEDVLILYNDGYGASETAKYISSKIDIEEIRNSNMSTGIGARWR